MDGPTLEIEVVRETIQEGRSFSSDAMDGAIESASAWIGSRVMRRWNETGEPPTALRITITVDVS